LSTKSEDYIVPIPYANERDRRIYEPGYFHAEQFLGLDDEERRAQRLKFYRMERVSDSAKA